MFKKNPPVINIGSRLSNSCTNANSQASFTNNSVQTFAQPTAIERAGVALGQLIWKSAPVAKVVIVGAFSLLSEFGSSDDENNHGSDKKLSRYDQGHPDYDYWNG